MSNTPPAGAFNIFQNKPTTAVIRTNADCQFIPTPLPSETDYRIIQGDYISMYQSAMSTIEQNKTFWTFIATVASIAFFLLLGFLIYTIYRHKKERKYSSLA